jgi:hypothetical protein
MELFSALAALSNIALNQSVGGQAVLYGKFRVPRLDKLYCNRLVVQRCLRNEIEEPFIP